MKKISVLGILATSCALLTSFCTGLPAGADDAAAAASKLPEIVLVRHGEKPKEAQDDPKKMDSLYPDLSPEGYARAEKLAPYLKEKYGKPDFIFAAKSSKTKRPVETITPYSKLTGVPIDSTYDNGDEAKLATLLLSDKRYAGKLVVICWRHEEMPHFAHELNAPDGTYPAKWDSKVYNVYLQFDYKDGKKTPKVTQLSQPF